MGIIFDLDGTLLNTIDDIARVTNLSLKRFGYPEHEASEYSKMVGYGLKDLVIQALPENLDESIRESEIDKVFTTLMDEYRKNPVQTSSLYPGVPELLDRLSQMNIPMSILSNKNHEITLKIAEIVFPQWKFKVILGSKHGVHKKPDPGAAIEICEFMKCKPVDIVFVGDSETDVKTALAASMLPIGVSWGYRSVENIREAGAKVIIHTPGELLNFL